jgi:uncharacterized delta-60 repeat protein
MKYMLTSLMVLAVLAGCSSNPVPVASDSTQVEDSTNVTASGFCLKVVCPTPAKPGSLDTSFGQLNIFQPGTGKVTTAIGGNASANAVAFQVDGKIVVAGSGFGEYAFKLARYNSNGSLDTTFGSAGKVNTVPPEQPNSVHSTYVTSVGIQPDGKIVIGGGIGEDFAVARYDTNGSLDGSFGSDGIVRTNWVPEPDPGVLGYYFNGGNVRGLVVQPDGKILVTGTYNRNPISPYANVPDQAFVTVVRYNQNGSLDTSFGSTGYVHTTTYPGYFSVATSIALQSDGKIVVSGFDAPNSSTSDMAVVRYNANGTYDTSFDIDGIARVGFVGLSSDYANAVKIQSDGKIVLAGHSNASGKYDFAVARLNADGSRDTAFGSNGILTTPIYPAFDRASSLGIQSDGKIVVAGTSSSSGDNQFAMARYNSNGSLDTTFGFYNSGRLRIKFGSNYDNVNALGIQSNGRIVLAGSSFNGTQDVFALARFNP